MRIYCINLDRNPERLAHMTAVFRALNLDFIRFSAVDGALLSPTNVAHYRDHQIHALTIGEIGCFLSHCALWHKIAEEDAPVAAIFEDDVQVSSRLGGFLSAIAALEALPGDADILKLDTMGTVASVVRRPVANIAHVDLKTLLSRHMGAAAYILSKPAAKYLAEQADSLVFPADYIFVNELPQFAALKVLQAVPALAMQDNYRRGRFVQRGLGSTIDQMSSLRKTSLLSVPQKIRREIGRGMTRLRDHLVWYGSMRWRHQQRSRIAFQDHEALKL